MSVTERLMGLGKWSVKLKPTAPLWILEQVDYFGSIVITTGRVFYEQDGMSDADMLEAAAYTGQVTEIPRRDRLTISGVSNRGWLGDGNNGGDILEVAYSPGTRSLTGGPGYSERLTVSRRR